MTMTIQHHHITHAHITQSQSPVLIYSPNHTPITFRPVWLYLHTTTDDNPNNNNNQPTNDAAPVPPPPFHPFPHLLDIWRHEA